MGQINKTKEYRAELAEMFARILEEESLNWKKTWKGWSDRPLNAVHGNIYKGINSLSALGNLSSDSKNGISLKERKGNGSNRGILVSI